MAVEIKKASQKAPETGAGEQAPAANLQAKTPLKKSPQGLASAPPNIPLPKKPKLSKNKQKSNLGLDKSVQDAEKLMAQIKEKQSKSDDELFQEIQVRPENEHKKTHRLDREQQDARLVLMHRLLIRKVSHTDIMAQLGLSEEMFYYLKPKLDASMRLDVSKLDVPYMIGDSLALYDEVRSMALIISSKPKLDERVKLAAMNVVLKAEQDKNAFLTQCGVYAPQIVEHLIRGMINSGTPSMLSGINQTQTKNVEQMVGELMQVLTVSHTPVPTNTVENNDPMQLIAPEDNYDFPGE